MSVQPTAKYRKYRQPFRALALLVLTLCLLISCPLKRELRTALLPDVPVEQAVPGSRAAIAAILPADLAASCAKTIHSLLKEAEPRLLSSDFEFKNPILFLALSLAALYLSLLTGKHKTGFPLAYPAGTCTAKVPLFLRHRQLVI